MKTELTEQQKEQAAKAIAKSQGVWPREENKDFWFFQWRDLVTELAKVGLQITAKEEK